MPNLKLRSLPLLAAAATALVAATPAHATMFDGLTYTLVETPLSSTTAQFELEISGINGSSDAEGGRFGLEAFAFNRTPNFVSATAPGYTEVNGGLSSGGSGGCNMSGSFFCFAANTTPSTLLPANSTLNIFFDVTDSAGNFSEFGPGQDDSFKVQWVGTKNNYDHISADLPVNAVAPAPPIGRGLSALLAVGSMLFGVRLFERRRKSPPQAA